ncbi:LysR family transcriptional regulator [Pseudomonas sp. BN411]|uniref:LysR family transcriptional regulator n=1 Tax=Pseudomonas sp. BN411 TaxID=2567887 RepID=UPI002456850D|nr:LysR family transcriptional regulator [Pseudomonas sp. BN411]MDH4564228.1 LysR family transcriptional regulator [Pseudomonas sp. BN411]
MPRKTQSDNWDHLRYFLAVARFGTLSAAAEQLGTEHTTVSRHIGYLEKKLNIRLFHKSNTGYSLTSAGETMLESVQQIEGIVVASQNAIKDPETIEGTVRVGAPDGFGSLFLAPLVQGLLAKHSKLDVEIFAASRIFSLAKREADIAIGLASAEHSRVASRRLTDYKLLVYASRRYLAKSQPIKNRADLINHPFVGYAEDSLFAPELKYFDALSLDTIPRLRSTALLTQVFATLKSNALGILPCYIASEFPELIPILPDEISLTRSFYMHVHEDHRRAAHVRMVANFIAEQVHDNRAMFMGENL